MAFRVETYSSAGEFYHVAETHLLEREVENCLILGRLLTLRQEPDKPDNVHAIVFDGSRPLLCAMRSSSGLLITRASAESAAHFVEHIQFTQWPLRLSGPLESARRLAGLIGDRSGKPSRERFLMRLFQLGRVVPPTRVPGSMRCAEESDIGRLVQWASAFSIEIGDPGATRVGVMKRLDQRQYFLWEVDGEPVSMAAWSGRTPNGVRINSVYTPPDLRGRGYASNCVASLSQRLLDTGSRFCCLFTDMANPTSNRIYQQMGYTPVCDWIDMTLG